MRPQIFTFSSSAGKYLNKGIIMNEELFMAELLRLMMETGLLPDMLLMVTVIAVSLLVKEFLQSFVEGFSFYLKRSFRQGDQVFVDDKKAVIIKIGILQTILQIRDDRGVIWRYVPNNRVKYLKLEKVVEKNGVDKSSNEKIEVSGKKIVPSKESSEAIDNNGGDDT